MQDKAAFDQPYHRAREDHRPMKLTGILILTLGALLTVWLLLWPTKVNVYGSSVDCGTPLFASYSVVMDSTDVATESLDAYVTNQCETQDDERKIIAFVIAVIAGISGGFCLYYRAR
jgi:hypothetical protein